MTMSAGNFGRSLAYGASRTAGLSATVVMPETAPASRARIISELGAKVERHPSSHLRARVSELESQENMVFFHPFDDADLIAGYGSIGCELLEDVSAMLGGVGGCVCVCMCACGWGGRGGVLVYGSVSPPFLITHPIPITHVKLHISKTNNSLGLSLSLSLSLSLTHSLTHSLFCAQIRTCTH